MHTQLVGILNLTPDSFSGDGKTADQALAAIAAMAKEGIAVIDIGAESTRPGAVPLAPEAEWARLEPVLKEALPRRDFRISVDTRHAETARKALAMGAHWINDVSGFQDSAMIEAVSASECRVVMMHSLTVPADSRIVLPEDQDVVETLIGWAEARLHALEKAGIARSRVIFDPGLGFGKTPAQSLHILKNLQAFKALELPILIGHSRKSFLKGFADESLEARNALTLAVSALLMEQNVDYLRVHDTRAHAGLARFYESVR